MSYMRPSVCLGFSLAINQTTQRSYVVCFHSSSSCSLKIEISFCVSTNHPEKSVPSLYELMSLNPFKEGECNESQVKSNGMSR
jgi:hypothetical protein